MILGGAVAYGPGCDESFELVNCLFRIECCPMQGVSLTRLC